MDIETKQLVMAVRTIAEEKNLPEAVVQDAIEQALAAAWRRDFGDKDQEVRSVININDGTVMVYITKTIVDKVTDEALEISLGDAQVIRKNAAVGETIEIEEKVENFGRVAAQTAKQVILQRLREAEREVVLAEFEDKIHTVLNAIVTRIEGRMVRIEINRAQGILPPSEQIQGERYHPGQRLKVYLKDVERGFKGAQLVVSRGCPEFIEHLFRNEVPEMEANAVEIKGIAREAGVRTKLAVSSNIAGIDPVGTFVGGHGTRVQAVMSEIGEQEKIDIVVWAENTKEYIINALSPTKVVSVALQEEAKKATVTVEEDQLSIAIGRSGQNVRLASRLTGYDIDVVGEKAKEDVIDKKDTVIGASNAPKLKKKSDLESSLLEAIEEHGEEA
jgi:N utilization substance protein A